MIQNGRDETGRFVEGGHPLISHHANITSYKKGHIPQITQICPHGVLGIRNCKLCQKEYRYQNKEKLKKQNQSYYQQVYRQTVRERYKNNEEYRKKILAYAVKERKKLKELVIAHYSKGSMSCVGWNGKGCPFHCTDMRALQIDHIAGGGTKHLKEIHRSGTSFYQWLKKNNWPVGYQVLCANCNQIKKNENKELPGRPRRIFA